MDMAPPFYNFSPLVRANSDLAVAFIFVSPGRIPYAIFAAAAEMFGAVYRETV